MGKYYSHLQTEDRVLIHELLYSGWAISSIADVLKVDKSTIYRELHRNSGKTGYRPLSAQLNYKARQNNKPSKLDNDPELKSFVIEKLNRGWSPEIIDGYLKKQQKKQVISYETIYRFIYSPEGLKLKLYQHLFRKRRYRYSRIKRRRKTIANERKRKIADRSESINQRRQFGHREGDLILFRKTKTNLFTLRERKSRYMVAIKNPSRKAEITNHSLFQYIDKHIPLKNVKSMTLDNGVEFAYHEKMSKKLRAKIYYCEPYKSYQKGAIENANKLLRTKLPRHTDIDSISQNDIDKVSQIFNNRPMKCLGYETPKAVYDKAMGNKVNLGSRCT